MARTGKQLYKKYGGKIFAIAQVIGPVEGISSDDIEIHWRSRLYSNMGNIWLLEHPIDISRFREYVTLSSHGAITPVYKEEYRGIKQLVLEENQNPPEYFINAIAADRETSRIDQYNWLRIAPEYRHSFIYEKQFRLYYVDYFLSALGDIKTIYSECRCVKHSVTEFSRVDNVIRFYGRYLPVEVKLSVPFEYNIVAQLSKYCNDDEVYIDKSENRGIRRDFLYHNHVLVIDTENLFLYDDRTGVVDDIYDLENIHTMEDIAAFQEQLSELLLREYEPIPQTNGRKRRYQALNSMKNEANCDQSSKAGL